MTLSAVLVAAGVLGTLVARRLATTWSGPPFLLAGIVASLASMVVCSILLGLVGLFAAWWVVLGMAAVAIAVALVVPVPDSADVHETEPGDGAPASARVLSAVPVGLAIGAALTGVWARIGTGMTGFDTTWYHGPVAAEFIRTGETSTLHFTSPQFLTWFYPHSSELLHALAGSAWGGDLPSLFLNVALLAGSLLAAWVIARPSGGIAGPVSVAGVALALGCSAAVADQFGEARNDLFGAFSLLAGLAILVTRERTGDKRSGTAFLVGLAAGLAAGTKLNFVPPAALLALGPAFLAATGDRLRTLAAAGLGALLTGAFWYFRNLLRSGNPLPWTAGDRVLGIELPGPVQETGGRDPGSVLDYAFDGAVITDWFLPGLAAGFGPLWPVPLLLGLAGIALAIVRPPAPALRIGGLVAVAVVLTWLVGPTSASGPTGEPLGFVSGLRYLIPGIAIGLALLGPVIARRDPRVGWSVLGAIVVLAVLSIFEDRSWEAMDAVIIVAATAAIVLIVAFSSVAGRPSRLALRAGGIVGFAVVLLVGYQLSWRYERDRYSQPSFTVQALDRAFALGDRLGPGPVGSTATRSYPFRGPDLRREVSYPGVRTGGGGLVPAVDCRTFRRLVNDAGYRYLILSLDREGRVRRYPPEVRWVSGDPAVREVFRQPPTVVFEVTGPLDPGGCR